LKACAVARKHPGVGVGSSIFGEQERINFGERGEMVNADQNSRRMEEDDDRSRLEKSTPFS
jgi:hypothetical protein